MRLSELASIDWVAVKGWLGKAMDQLKPLFTLFEGPELAIGLAIVLLVAGGVVWVLMVARILPIWVRLVSLTRYVRPHQETYAKFRAVFPEFGERLQKLKFLRHGWLEFSETLVIRDDPDEPILNTARPQLYINVQAVESSGTSLRLFQALPNYFVGFGLLFTFLGLVAAIYFASEGVASKDVDKAQESLGNLLHAATFKFLTSIAGLGVSIILSFSYRVLVQSLQLQFDKLCEAMEKGMLFATRESIAFGQLEELKEQTAQLKRFNTDFAIEVGKVLEERIRDSMSESLAQALKPMSAALERFSSNVGEMNQEALADMTKAFGDDLKAAAGDEMNALIITLDDIKGALGSVVAEIDRTSTGLGARVDQSATKMEELLGAAGERLRETASGAGDAFAKKLEGASTDLGDKLQPLADQLGRFQSIVDGLDAKMQAQRNAFEDVAQSVRDITGGVRTTIEELSAATSPMARVAERLAAAARDMSAAGTAVSDSQQELRALADTLGETARSTQTVWQDYQSRFEGVDRSLAGAVGQLVAGADAYREHVQSFVSELDQQLDKAVRSLRVGIEGLQDSIEELIDRKE
jgi:methyl-accepting chemotaxis protein